MLREADRLVRLPSILELQVTVGGHGETKGSGQNIFVLGSANTSSLEKLQIFGLVELFGLLEPIIDDVLIVQALWFVVAGVALMTGERRA